MKAYKTTIHTDGDTVNVVHHSSKIIEHNLVNKTIKLNNDGWFSKTTKDRMNAYFNENNLSAFGIFSIIGKGRDAINKIKGVQDDFQTPFAIGRVRDDDIKFKKQTEIGEEGFKKRVAARKIVTYSRVLSPDGKKILPKKKFVIKSDEQIAEIPRKKQTTSEVGGDPTKKTTTITKDDIRGSKGTKQRRLSQNFGKDGSGKVNINKININKIFERGKNIN